VKMEIECADPRVEMIFEYMDEDLAKMMRRVKNPSFIPVRVPVALASNSCIKFSPECSTCMETRCFIVI
jgi:hypothetical protein